MSYYRLKERYVLRGWERLPYALQDTRSGLVSFLDEKAFQAVSFCNGILDVDGPLLLPAHREVIKKLKENSVIEECAERDGLQPYQEYRLIPCRFMMRAHWSITGKCNLRCRHCYMSAPQAKYGELSHQQCLDIIRQISEAGIGQVSLTGGEPLVRSDFLEIVDALLSLKISIVQIYTNGVLVNQTLLDELKNRSCLPEFSLSFDGVGCHDWLRGVEGAEKKAVEAIKMLRTNGFPVSIESALHKGNVHTMEAMLNLFRELGVAKWKTSPASDAGNWLNEGGRYNLTVEELYRTYLDFLPAYKAAGAPLNIMLGGFFSCQKGSDKYHIPCKKFDGSDRMLRQTICGSARNTMYIAADGKLLPCIPLTGLSVPADLPSVTEMDICRALSDSNYLKLIDMRLEDLLKANAQCHACEHRLYCGGGCRAGALLCSGEYLGRDDYTCYFFRNKFEEKIKAVYS